MPQYKSRFFSARKSLLPVRPDHGLSLVTVICLGTVSTLWLGAIMGTILPTYQRTTATRTANLNRSACEAALEVAVSSIDNAMATNGSSPYDAPPGGSVVSNISSSMTGVPQTSTQIRVMNRRPLPNTMPGGAIASIYDASLNTMINNGQIANPYRIIEATSRVPGSNIEKRIRVILEPRVQSSGIVFPYAGFGRDRMLVVGNVRTDSYIPGVAADPVQDRLSASLGSNKNTAHVGVDTYNLMNIGGNQYEFPDPVPGQMADMQDIGSTFNASLVTQAKWAQYMGNVYSNGSSTAHYPAGPAQFGNSTNPASVVGNHPSPNSQGWKNVRGLQNVNSSGQWTGGKVEAYASYKQIELPQPPSAPNGAVNLGNVNLKGTAKLVIEQGAPPPSPATFTNAISSGTIKIPPGDYKFNTLSMSNSAQISLSANSQANFYFESGATGTILSVSKDARINNGSGADAKNLKIYAKGSDANGTQFIAINGTSRALVYAPNTTVFVGTGSNGSGSNTSNISGFNNSSYGSTNLDFYGSVVGREAYIWANINDTANSQVRFHYDRSLIPAGFNFLSTGNSSSFGPPGQVAGVRAVSWQEDPAALP